MSSLMRTRDFVLIAMVILVAFLVPHGASGQAKDFTALPVYKAKVTFDISADLTVTEIYELTFSRPVNNTIYYWIDEPIAGFSAQSSNAQITYNLTPSGTSTLAQLHIPEKITNLRVSYVSANKVFQNEGTFLFSDELDLYRNTRKLETYVLIPPGHSIVQETYTPTTGDVMSDGQRIFLEWKEDDPALPKAFSVKFGRADSMPRVPKIFENNTIRSMDVLLDINKDKTVRETISLQFTAPINHTVNFTLRDRVRDIAVTDGVNRIGHSVVTLGDSRILRLDPPAPTDRIHISYTVDNKIFLKDDVNFFFSEYSYGKIFDRVNARLNLPPGYTLYLNSYSPQEGEVISDGDSISIVWNLSNSFPPVTFSAQFRDTSPRSTAFALVSAFLILSLVGGMLYYKYRAKEEFLQGFRSDEQKVIKYLQEKKTTLQSIIQREFGFSRAKATRMIKKLEEKGLISKENLGRTNRITWIK